jgi:DNA-binding NarL/FixJ family response regulator
VVFDDITSGGGLANSEIAAELFMSVATVKAYVSRLFTKLGVEIGAQIALLVQERNADRRAL